MARRSYQINLLASDLSFLAPQTGIYIRLPVGIAELFEVALGGGEETGVVEKVVKPVTEDNGEVGRVDVWFPLNVTTLVKLVISVCRRFREGNRVSWSGPVRVEDNGGKAVWSF